ncbi:hypothetical protein B0O80DRAFT_145664 [Mortierella sp. GBAus27b]|nr:hypothetical protein B0O80DRAFT_145664 [Mortierella sp. GBAus27b]
MFGAYVLTVIQMIKSRVSVDGMTIPEMSQLLGLDKMDQSEEFVAKVVEMVNVGIVRMMDCIQKVSRNGQGVDTGGDETENQTKMIDDLNATDLSKLRMFLRHKQEKTLGNLYRTVDSDGQARWMCSDHYREKHPERDSQAIQEVVSSMNGVLDESIGRIEVVLPTIEHSQRFFSALRNFQAVYDLKLTFLWHPFYQDFKWLREILSQKNIGSIELRFQENSRVPVRLLKTGPNCQYEPIMEIMRQPSVYSFAFTMAPWDIFNQSGLLNRNDSYANLRYLELDLDNLDARTEGLKKLVANVPNLVELCVIVRVDGVPDVYSTIVEHQTFPIFFKNQGLRILPPERSLRHSKAILPAVSELLRVYGRQVEALAFTKDWNVEVSAQGLIEGIQKESRLKELSVKEIRQSLGKRCIGHFASIVGQSELRKLEIGLGDEVDRVQILEKIQWAHLRELTIGLQHEGQLMMAMNGIMNHVKWTMSGKVELEYFKLYSEGFQGNMTAEERAVLRSFLLATTLQHLELNTTMNVNQVVVLLKAIDVTRLRHLCLWAAGFNSTEVQIVLNALGRAIELQTLVLRRASISDEQRERLNARGITLETW